MTVLQGRRILPNLRNVLLRAANRGDRLMAEWVLGHLVDGRPCFLPASCRVVTAVPSHLVSMENIMVCVDLPEGAIMEAKRVKFHVPQTHQPTVLADVIQWHVEPSALQLEGSSTILGFGVEIDPALYPGCLIREYPEIRLNPHPDMVVQTNPLHYMALGALTQELMVESLEKLSDSEVEAALGEVMDGVTDTDLEAAILQKAPPDIDADDYLDLIRYRTPNEIATACNKLFLAEYDFALVTLPEALLPFQRKLQGRTKPY